MMNESRERIRREREREKNTYTSPRLALRRVLLLAEGRQFREAAAILSRLGPGVLGSVATELPIDLLVESLPHSAHLLETLLNRLISLEISPRPDVQCEAIAWRLVSLLGGEQGPSLRGTISKLAASLQQYAPDLADTVDSRRRQLDAAVHGLGTHGLTADTSGALTSLHAALKAELQQHVEVYKQALHKLDELSPVTISQEPVSSFHQRLLSLSHADVERHLIDNKSLLTASPVTVSQEPASSSHQRLLSLSHADVERRLIDNKSLLTAVDKPALQLPALLRALAARVEADKLVLASVGLLRRTQPLDLANGRPIAGVLMSMSRGCVALLGLMLGEAGLQTREASLTSRDSGHTPHEPDEASLTSEDKPRPPRSPPDSLSDGYHSDSDDSQRTHDRRSIISQYAGAWRLARRALLPALGALPELRRAPALQYKIVFSVAVLSFRAAISLRERRLASLHSLLGISPELSGAGSGASSGAGNGARAERAAAAAAARALRHTAHCYPLDDAEQTVVNQVVSTLREYPSLSSVGALRSLAAACVRAAWQIQALRPAPRLCTDFTPLTLSPGLHTRLPGSREDSDRISTFVWPALLDGATVVHKAVVIT